VVAPHGVVMMMALVVVPLLLQEDWHQEEEEDPFHLPVSSMLAMSYPSLSPPSSPHTW